MQEDYLKLLNVPPPQLPYQFCIICPVPLFHVTASHHIFLASLLVGRKLVLMYKWYVLLARRFREYSNKELTFLQGHCQDPRVD